MTLDSIPTQLVRIGGVSLQAGGALDPESPETERAIKVSGLPLFEFCKG